MPFSDCTKEEFEKLMLSLKNVDLTKVVEIQDNTKLNDQLACSGNNCEIS